MEISLSSLNYSTYNERLEKAGIKTIYPEDYDIKHQFHLVKLEYNGKIIKRPCAGKVYEVVLKEFNLRI